MSVVHRYKEGPWTLEIRTGMLAGDKVIDSVTLEAGGARLTLISDNPFEDPDYPMSSVVTSFAKLVKAWLDDEGNDEIKVAEKRPRKPPKTGYVAVKGKSQKVTFDHD